MRESAPKRILALRRKSSDIGHDGVLGRHSWSFRRIAEALGVHQQTVARCVRLAEAGARTGHYARRPQTIWSLVIEGHQNFSMNSTTRRVPSSWLT